MNGARKGRPAALLASNVRDALRDYYRATEEADPTIIPAGDSRQHRDPTTGSIVRQDAEPVFTFVDEIDGQQVLQELGDEIRAHRKAIKHARRYMDAAIIAIRQQHETRPATIVRESGLPPATVYSVMDRGGVSPVVRDDEQPAALDMTEEETDEDLERWVETGGTDS